MRLNGLPPWFRLAIQIEIDEETGCWNFCGFKSGVRDYEGKSIAAHRASWFIHCGDPGEECVLHDCDNRRCCNPGHLCLGDKKQNRADFMARHPRAKEIIASAVEASRSFVRAFWSSMTPEKRREFIDRRAAAQAAKRKERQNALYVF